MTKRTPGPGIPILKGIPYVGKYLFGMTKKEENRSELLVFLTPYVIDDGADMDREARRRKDYINATDIWTKGWSDSKLADPVSAAEMKLRLERKKEIEKAWRQYRKNLEDQHDVDTKIIDERTKTEAVIDAKAAEVSVREASAEQQPIGTLKVTESVEVLGPTAAPEGERSQEAAAPGRSEAEEPKKSWWRPW